MQVSLTSMHRFSRIVQENGGDFDNALSGMLPAATPTANALHSIERRPNTVNEFQQSNSAYCWGPQSQPVTRHPSTVPSMTRSYSENQSIPRHFQPSSPMAPIQYGRSFLNNRESGSAYAGSPATPASSSAIQASAYRGARLNPHDEYAFLLIT